MLGLFLASLGLATAVAGISLVTPDASPRGCAGAAFRTLRFWTLYLGCFGALGAALSALSISGPMLVVAAAGGAGLLARILWPWFGDATAEIGLGHLIGHEARVLLPVGHSSGKIVVQTQAQRVELSARSDDGGRIERGGRVLVAFIENGVAAVVRLDPGPRGG